MSSGFKERNNESEGANSVQPSSSRDAQEERMKKIKVEVEKKLEPGFREEMENVIKGEIKEKGINKISPTQGNKGDQLEKIKKIAESEARKRDLTNFNPLPQNMARSGRDEGLSIDSKKQEEIDKYTEEAKHEAQKEIEKASKQVKSVKAKIALKIAGDHFDKIAIVIAQKMAKEANRGGLHAIIPIAMTYFIAIGKDLIDVIINLLSFTGVGAIVVTVVMAIVGGICAIILAVFWISIGGEWKGGILKKKFLKMILKRYGVRIVLIVVVGDSIAVFNILPLMLLFNIWAHFDFIMDVKKSKAKFKSFMEEYASKKRIKKSIAKRYISKIQQE